MGLYRAGVTDRDRRQAAALLGTATSRENPGTPASLSAHPWSSPTEIDEVLELKMGLGRVELPTSRLSAMRRRGDRMGGCQTHRPAPSTAAFISATQFGITRRYDALVCSGPCR
jgi:hypothetical protein